MEGMGLRIGVLLALILAGCVTVPSPTSGPSRSSEPTIAPPQSVQIRTHPNKRCVDMNNPLRLEADPDAPVGEQVWVVAEGSLADEIKQLGNRLWPVWPRGYTARFAPDLRVFDQDGALVIYEGQSFVSDNTTDGTEGGSIHICRIDRLE